MNVNKTVKFLVIQITKKTTVPFWIFSFLVEEVHNFSQNLGKRLQPTENCLCKNGEHFNIKISQFIQNVSPKPHKNILLTYLEEDFSLYKLCLDDYKNMQKVRFDRTWIKWCSRCQKYDTNYIVANVTLSL